VGFYEFFVERIVVEYFLQIISHVILFYEIR
jgi:hypothetical protein